ncbi:MAG: hsp90 co-chaperone Cdc37 [Chrysothrix sp. TS-e1954]|nr:MAG: hsp90 co-chaperone Cdc37 [Chrysothrix sp. TS-e1954]
MPVDYSKWDALELSDDSDIEVHPNVDKRSFIRAKQNQIHQERAHRKHEIDTLRYERIINDGLLTRIDALMSSLQAHASAKAEEDPSPDELVYQSLIESVGDLSKDQPPPKPVGVHEKVKGEQPTFSKMMAALVDQVKTAVEENKTMEPGSKIGLYVEEIKTHKAKVLDLQQQLLKKLAELEKLEGSKITSDSIHDGFSTSHVARKDIESTPSTSLSHSTELLNPTSAKSSSVPSIASPAVDSGSEADVEDGTSSERTIRPTALGKAFVKLPPNSYQSYLEFISKHREVLVERETDGLLMQAFDLQHENKPAEARHAVHQALLLQYCRALGKDGVGLFFKRITTKDHQARKVFFDDVNQTYARVKDRTKEMTKESLQPEGEGEGVEQIQLQAVNPGSKIHITVPDENATDEETKEARKLYETFPPGLQRALTSGRLDEVNSVLGKMSVEEAEEIVEKLSAGGMLNMEEGVVDATTEEGKRQVEEIERRAKMDEANEDDVQGEPGDAVEEKLAVDEVD